ncbi:hypothetical protein IWQ56_006999 [Coemansia nantahalensis]|uniref:Uncharacterized protein n=1 Tax=Coemansia nantahalensis TaxID=2789366 RepID=A0ACC1K0K7_9FUNG|nr:hypothetical protein IWQ56_006999 [Coemansia nantahalensis]KAJ2771134.1 hypothetical protein IWQ57_002347 [Coemansia nantahalensis]
MSYAKPIQVFAVTGASGALGRAIVQTLAGPANRHIVLVGRDQRTLEELAGEVAAGDSVLHVVSGADAAQPGAAAEAVVAKLLDVLAAVGGERVGQLVLVHSAGTLSDLRKRADQYGNDEIAAYTTVNFVSFAVLAARFLEFAKDTGAERIGVVNISSLLAIQPFANWGLYAATRAGRDQLMRVVALEHANDPRVKTLSYAPGPLVGDMQASVRAEIADPAQRELYDRLHREGKLVRPADTARLMCDLVHAWEFESGAHVDVFDLVPPPA